MTLKDKIHHNANINIFKKTEVKNTRKAKLPALFINFTIVQKSNIELIEHYK